MANRDTLRAYTDLCVFIDQDDWVHVAFTTRSYFEIQGTSYWHASIIWHWSEQYSPLWPDNGDFRMIHNAFDDWWWNFTDCGAWNVKAQRPSLGQDPETDYVYCTYQVYDCDTTALSAAGWPSGEVYVSVTTDGGLTWAEGTNVTETITPENAMAGQCLSELSPSMAKLVNDTCQILYVLDRDAGFVVQEEGTWTQNNVIYHRVPVDLIPTEPLVPQDVVLHVEIVGVEPEPPLQAYDFKLFKPYPNPFNPVATICYYLPAATEVHLGIYDVTGREIATPAEGLKQSGMHQAWFDAKGLSSGIYVYRLEAGAYTASGKMVLMK
jgi:hypothetical protein